MQGGVQNVHSARIRESSKHRVCSKVANSTEQGFEVCKMCTLIIVLERLWRGGVTLG